MKHTTDIGVVHGRFQPPHNGHIRYILAALEKADRVIIGICTPAICTKEEAARTGYPCTRALNPFTYSERVAMITLALWEADVAPERYEFVAFPSDYKNIEAIIPKGAVFLMSVTGGSDSEKIEHLQTLGYAVETVFSILPELDRERSGHIRESGRAGDGSWEHMVPKCVAGYMKEHGMLDRLSMLE